MKKKTLLQSIEKIKTAIVLLTETPKNTLGNITVKKKLV